jgi:hypothetical protein
MICKNDKCVVILDKEQYDRLFWAVHELQPYKMLSTQKYSFIRKPTKLKKPIGRDDVNKYLEQHHAVLGREIKQYNPYVWQQELVFESEEYAVLYYLKGH